MDVTTVEVEGLSFASGPMHLRSLSDPISGLPEDIHIRQVSFDFASEPDADGWAILTSDEKARALRFVRREDRIRFAATRAALRTCLAVATGRSPAALRFAASDYGRPFLLQDQNRRGTIDFNVSHSGEKALITWSAARRLGIDIEKRRPDVDWAAISPMVLGAQDAQAVERCPVAMQSALLYAIWVAKEALLKAVGLGLAVPLNRFSVVSASGAPRLSCDEVNLEASLGSYRMCWIGGLGNYSACLAWFAS